MSVAARTSLLLSLACLPLVAANFDSANTVSANAPLEITSITPTGEEINSTHQLVITFNQAVVPLGEMARKNSEIPISIQPAVQCEWRWLDPRKLACQIKPATPIKLATRYSLRIRPGIKTQNGRTLAKEYTHHFQTARPKVVHTFVQLWKSPQTPLIELRFNQRVFLTSLKSNVYFSSGHDRIAIKAHSSDGKVLNYWSDSWRVEPSTPLPLNRPVELKIEPGLVAEPGPLKGLEKRSLGQFHTFPELRFLGARCVSQTDKKIHIPPTPVQGQAPAPAQAPLRPRCSPESGLELDFSAPINELSLIEALSYSPALPHAKELKEQAISEARYARDVRDEHSKGQVYSYHLGSLLPYQSYSIQAGPKKIKDRFKRTLSQALAINLATDHLKPKIGAFSQITVMPKQLKMLFPMELLNIDKIRVTTQALMAQGTSASRTRDYPVPRAWDQIQSFGIDVKPLFEQSDGLVFGSLTTKPKTENDRHANDSSPLVMLASPFEIHAKLGHYNSLVWVKDIRTHQPVANARLSLLVGNLKTLNINSPLFPTKTDSQGIAWLPGTVELDPKLSLLGQGIDQRLLYVRVEKDSDVAYLPLSVEFQYSNYSDINTSRQGAYGHLKAWGMTAQGIYKLGDIVEYKIFVRNQSNSGLVAAPKQHYHLKITDPLHKIVHEQKNLHLSDFGTLVGQFTVPAQGAAGTYRVELGSSLNSKLLHPFTVLVADFRPAPFKVSQELSAKLLRHGETLKVSTHAALHAGGPYQKPKVRLTLNLQHAAFSPSHMLAKGFHFDVPHSYRSTTVGQALATGDSQGAHQQGFAVTETEPVYGRLEVESAVSDDRGKWTSTQASIPYAARDRYVGLKLDDWVLSANKPTKIQALIVDDAGSPAAGTSAKLTIEHEEHRISRSKDAQGEEQITVDRIWVQAGLCEFVSSHKVYDCEFIPRKSGQYRMNASITDTRQRVHTTQFSRWASGSEALYWDSDKSHRLDIISPRASYQPGDTAEFLIKNPFPQAHALVTVERFGTLEQWTTPLSGSIATVRVPIKAQHAPGFYLSVTLFAAETPKPNTNKADIRPAFRLGYARVEVTEAYRLNINIEPSKKVYRPSSEVNLNIQVKDPRGKPVKSELAIAVLDEAVFDLLGGGTRLFDPHQGLYVLDPADMINYNLLLQLVKQPEKLLELLEKRRSRNGKDRLYKSKSAPAPMEEKMESAKEGAPAGLLGKKGKIESKKEPGRRLFKSLAYWNGQVVTDTNGRAQVQFKIPDNLTRWKVLVLSADHAKQLGLGESGFQVNQPLEVRSSLPNQIAETDTLEARFWVMNRTATLKRIQVHLTATGAVKSTEVKKSVWVEAAPFERVTVNLPIVAGDTGTIQFHAVAQMDQFRDVSTVTLKVVPLKSKETAASYGTSENSPLNETLRLPEHTRVGSAHVAVVISATVIAHLDGAFQYMMSYPYACWEQRLTKGVMASHYQQLRAYLPATLAWPESRELPERTLRDAASFQAPNGGMTFYTPRNEQVSPYLSAYTALSFQWLRQHQHAIPAEVETRLHHYLARVLLAQDIPSYYTESSSATVRALVLDVLSAQGKASLADVKKHEADLGRMSLFGKAHYLNALGRFPGTEALQKQVVEQIRSAADETAGKYHFTEKLGPEYGHLLHTDTRTQCAILSAILRYESSAQQRASAIAPGIALAPASVQSSDMPFKLVRAISQARQAKGRWTNTQENMYCLNALGEYSRVYEKQTPNMQISATLNSKELGKGALAGFRAKPLTFQKTLDAAGTTRDLELKLLKQGPGRFYYSTRLSYDLSKLKDEEVNSGIAVTREYHVERSGQWLKLTNPMKLKQGELVRVDLFVNLPAPRYFVVVDDPVPGGLEPVNTELATASRVDAAKALAQYSQGSFWFKHRHWHAYGYSHWSFYHRELLHHAVRYYSEHLPAGNYHLSYVAQAIAPGEFTLMPTHVEEMYEPEVYGKSKPGVLHIAPSN